MLFWGWLMGFRVVSISLLLLFWLRYQLVRLCCLLRRFGLYSRSSRHSFFSCHRTFLRRNLSRDCRVMRARLIFCICLLWRSRVLFRGRCPDMIFLLRICRCRICCQSLQYLLLLLLRGFFGNDIEYFFYSFFFFVEVFFY